MQWQPDTSQRRGLMEAGLMYESVTALPCQHFPYRLALLRLHPSFITTSAEGILAGTFGLPLAMTVPATK